MTERKPVFEFNFRVDVGELFRRISNWRYLIWCEKKKSYEWKERVPLPEAAREEARQKFVNLVHIDTPTQENYLLALQLFLQNKGFVKNKTTHYLSWEDISRAVEKALRDEKQGTLKGKCKKYRKKLKNEDILETLKTVLSFSELRFDFEPEQTVQLKDFIHAMFDIVGIDFPVEEMEIRFVFRRD